MKSKHKRWRSFAKIFGDSRRTSKNPKPENATLCLNRSQTAIDKVVYRQSKISPNFRIPSMFSILPEIMRVTPKITQNCVNYPQDFPEILRVTPGISPNFCELPPGFLRIATGNPTNYPWDSANYPRDYANYPRDYANYPKDFP